MSFLESVTPVVLTWNEEPNVRRVLGKLSWAEQVVVVDSGSTDLTLSILAEHGNVRVHCRRFQSHAEQWNYALTGTDISTEWVLCLDADYVLSDALVQELRSLTPAMEIAGYEASFVYVVQGHALRGSLYPARVVLFRRTQGLFIQDGHTQRLRLHGMIARLNAKIVHDDRKPLGRWLSSQTAYAALESSRIAGTPLRERRLKDRLRVAGLSPCVAFAAALVWKRALLDGRPGIRYALERAIAEALIVLKVWESP